MGRPLLALLAVVLAATPAAARKPRPPATAPAFELPGRDGSVSLDSLRGHVVYVDFWASWCAPCAASFPWMAALHDRFAKQGLVIVAVNLDKDRAKANAFLARHPSPFLVAFDPAGKTAEQFHVSAMPSSFLVDPSGTVLHAEAGFDAEAAGRVETLIQEAVSR